MALEEDLKGGFRLFGQVKANKENRKAAEEARRQSFNTIKSLDWEPMYASDTVPQYQKTQSPVARSYLESFLAGNNPNMTFSGAPNAALTKQRQQQSQDAMFGTMDQRIAQQRAIEQQNPYKVQTPTRKVFSDQAQQGVFASSHPQATAAGLDSGTLQKLVDLGVIKDGGDLPWKVRDDAEGKRFTNAVRGAAAAGNTADLNQLLFPKLERPHAVMQRKQKKKASERSRNVVDKYSSDEED